MMLRPYTPADLEEILTLFYETVHTVNAADYTPAQRDAWAPAAPDRARWNTTLLAHTALVAVEEGRIVGFGDIDSSGYLDWLYVHKDRQRRGIATALCDALEAAVPPGRNLTTHASTTARLFFENPGYALVRTQQVVCRGVTMTNHMMLRRR